MMYTYIGAPYHIEELLTGSEFFRVLDNFLNNLNSIKEIDEETFVNTNRTLFYNDFLNIFSIIQIKPSRIEEINELIDEFISEYEHDSFIILFLPPLTLGLFPVKDEFIKEKLKKTCEINKLTINSFFLKYYGYELEEQLNTFILRKSNLFKEDTIISELFNFLEIFNHIIKSQSFNTFPRTLSKPIQNIHHGQEKVFKQKPIYSDLTRYFMLEKLLTMNINEVSIMKRAELYSFLLDVNKNTLKDYIRFRETKQKKPSKKSIKAQEIADNIFKNIKFF